MAREVRYWPAVVCLIVAALLEVLPLPDVLATWRPPFAAIAIIYWTVMWPNRISVGTAFLVGLFLDLLHGSLLGENALSLSIVCYLAFRFHLRIRIFPLWQMSLTVFALLAVNAFLQLWIDGVAGAPPAGVDRWTQVLAGALLWPILMGVMDRIRELTEPRSRSINY